MKFLLLPLLFTYSLLAKEPLTITTIVAGSVPYDGGIFNSISVRIICINGYKWLQTSSGNAITISQMFENNTTNSARAIPCSQN